MTPPLSSYIRRGARVADFIRDDGDKIVVELHDRRRVKWPKDGRNTVLEFGSLNQANANHEPGGKAIGTL